MSTGPGDLATRVRSGDLRAAARLMRWVDDGLPAGLAALSRLYRASAPSRLIGITGAPGAGKSTLIDRLITAHRAAGERVGVVAIDPTSPFSGGALLGDRVRMQDHALDEGVFVRSLANRGQMGGLSRSAMATVAVMEGVGFERVIIETVGIGQSEVDVARVADTTVVVLAPGQGDDIQALKAGLMEVADVFAINKADRPGARQVTRDVEQALQLRGPDEHGWMPAVVAVSAANGDGIDDLVGAIAAHRAHLDAHDLLVDRRRRRARLELETELLSRLRDKMLEAAGGAAGLDALARRVADRVEGAADASAALLDDACS